MEKADMQLLVVPNTTTATMGLPFQHQFCLGQEGAACLPYEPLNLPGAAHAIPSLVSLSKSQPAPKNGRHDSTNSCIANLHRAIIDRKICNRLWVPSLPCSVQSLRAPSQLCSLQKLVPTFFAVQARGGVTLGRRGKAKPGRARGLFAPPAKQVLERGDSKLGKRRRTSDYDFGDVMMPPLPGAKALTQLPVSLHCLECLCL